MSQEDFIFEKKRQKKLFENQIDFAMKNDLPLMLHVRSFENADAHTDVFEILDTKQREYDKKGLGKIRANFHFFTEGPEVVAEIVARDYMISLPGVITFANLDKTVLSIPLEYIMSETDSPFAAPKPYRGKTNTSLYISEILKKISEVKSIDEEKVREQTIKNTLNFFNIPKNLN
jgi:TatD DNase family protein